MSTKPPPRDAKRAVMTKWVLEQLQAHYSKIVIEEFAEEDRTGSLAEVIAIAESGDLEPLRGELSLLLEKAAQTPLQAEHLQYIVERFVNLPPRNRGQRYLRWADPVSRAVEDVKFIRALWKQHYGSERNKKGLVSAEEIAADRCNVTVDQIKDRLGRTRTKP
jgi:hypothetical protein